jgi:hypothetical protein
MDREQRQPFGHVLRISTDDRSQLARAREQRPDSPQRKRSHSRQLDASDNAFIECSR